MSGLLDPKTFAMLSAAGGLLQASQPAPIRTSTGAALGQGLNAGLLGYSQGLHNQRADAFVGFEKRKTELLEQQLKQAKAQFDFQQNILRQAGLLGGAPAAPAVPATGEQQPGMSQNTSQLMFGSPEFSSQPAAPTQAPSAPAGQQFPFTPSQIAMMKIAGLGDVSGAYNASQPNVEVRDGVMFDKKSGRVLGTIPTMNQQGFSTQLQPDGQGGWRVQQTPGGQEAFRNQQTTQQGAQAMFGAPVTIPSTSPNTPPQMVSPYNFGLQQGAPDVMGIRTPNKPAASVPAGMSPAATATQAARSQFGTQLAGKQAEDLAKSRQAAGEAVEMIHTFSEGRKLLDSGIVTGAGANFITNMGRGLSQAGITFAQDPVANTQAFSAVMAQNVGKIIKQFGAGTGLSDADREYAAAMAGGKIALEEPALRKIIEIGERASRNVIKLHNKNAEGIESIIPLKVTEPPAYKSPLPRNSSPLPAGVTVRRVGG